MQRLKIENVLEPDELHNKALLSTPILYRMCASLRQDTQCRHDNLLLSLLKSRLGEQRFLAPQNTPPRPKEVTPLSADFRGPRTRVKYVFLS